MVIDIDSFLDKFEKDDDTTQNSGKKKVDLNFQKDVEDRLLEIQNESKSQDLEFLKNVYDEVKAFNVDLPSKFLGLENKGGDGLKELGEKYTHDFLDTNKKNAKSIEESINSKMSDLDNALLGPDFTKILVIFKEIIKEYNYFPKTMLEEKIILGNKLKNKEIEIFKTLNLYKKEKVIEYKKSIREEVLELKTQLQKNHLAAVEEKVRDLQHLIESIPKILLSSLIEEKVNVSNILITAEKYLLKRYTRDFDEKKNLIDKLSEKFHSYYINKNLNEVLLTYNEIIFEFKSMPDFFLERKIEIYKDINILYKKLNKLLINRNIFLLMESYEYGKRLESIREYLNHVSITKSYNVDNLLQLKEKIEKLPKRHKFEKEDLLGQIEDLLEEAEIKENLNKVKNEVVEKNIPETKINESDSNPITEVKELNPKQNNKYLDEINILYKKFKDESNPQEIKLLYKKIIFAVNVSPIEQKIKTEIVKKVNKALYEKKLI
jgi:hypothetical protein